MLLTAPEAPLSSSFVQVEVDDEVTWTPEAAEMFELKLALQTVSALDLHNSTTSPSSTSVG